MNDRPTCCSGHRKGLHGLGFRALGLRVLGFRVFVDQAANWETPAKEAHPPNTAFWPKL